MDGIVSPQWFYEPLRDGLRTAGHTVAYAVLRPSMTVCSSRASSHGAHAAADPAVLERLWQEFADLGALEHHVIDTTALTPAEAAELLAQRLRDGVLTV